VRWGGRDHLTNGMDGVEGLWPCWRLFAPLRLRAHAGTNSKAGRGGNAGVSWRRYSSPDRLLETPKPSTLIGDWQWYVVHWRERKRRGALGDEVVAISLVCTGAMAHAQ
jgi:hypothetical protein